MTSQERIRVLGVDGHALIREGIASMVTPQRKRAIQGGLAGRFAR
jgi:hypothetical protein